MAKEINTIGVLTSGDGDLTLWQSLQHENGSIMRTK